MDKIKPAYLFQRYFNQVATEEEKAELMAWISRDENAEEVKALMDKTWKEFRETGKTFTTAESEEMLHTILQKEANRSTSSKPVHKVKFMHWRRMAAVAVILALIATAGYYFIFVPEKTNTSNANTNIVKHEKNDVMPGGNKAILTLANGKTIVLDSSTNGMLAQQGNTKVAKVNNGTVKFSKQLAVGSKQLAMGNGQSSSTSVEVNRRQQEVQYNMLSTPRGGQYQLILPDGSKVWLNAASSIRFPAAFTEKERRVKITGEAYFEIAKNESKPFVVHVNSSMGGLDVKVLGTHFNINAYQNEPSIKTTLIEGAIRVVKNDNSKLLKPGQQATIEKSTNKISLSEANIEEVTAWKNGFFYFEGEDMATIMHKISRWYGVEVIYQGHIPDGHYSGIVSRNTNLSQVIEVLKLSGIQFKIKGKELIVIN